MKTGFERGLIYQLRTKPLLPLFPSLALGILIAACACAAASSPNAAAQRMTRYNVIWHTPSSDATGVMPIGNGDIAAGVYVIENGDLYLLLAKNDAVITSWSRKSGWSASRFKSCRAHQTQKSGEKTAFIGKN